MAEIHWKDVKKILVVRLRSIGDTVLTTPSLIALRRFLPDAQIDVLLEDWVAPILDGFDDVDNVLKVSKDTKSRLSIARQIRKEKYDVAFNLHGGTTATFFVRATGAKHRVGYKYFQYSFLYNHRLDSPESFWKSEYAHSAEQQLGLLGFVGVPVEDRPKSKLSVTKTATKSLDEKLKNSKPVENNASIALLHPVAAFETKQWATEKFARVAEFLGEKGFQTVAVATKTEREILSKLSTLSNVPIVTFYDLSLPEITALASRAELFVGNDSGIAHIASAVNTPSVVIFGSSNRNHWRPWTESPHEIVFEEMPCQPCTGYSCEEFDAPKCILTIKSKSVMKAISKLV